MENSPYNQSSHYRKYGIFDRWSARLILHLKYPRCLTMASFRFKFFEHGGQCSKQKKNVGSIPAGSALTVVPHWSQKARTANCHLRAKGERNGLQRRTKVIFGKTMMQTMELLRLVKRHISGWSDVEQWRNWASSYSHYRVTLVWRQSVSQSVSRKIH